jgi:hypothetical protein
MTQAAVERQRRQEADLRRVHPSCFSFSIITYQFEPEREDDRMLAESNFLRMRLGSPPQ